MPIDVALIGENPNRDKLQAFESNPNRIYMSAISIMNLRAYILGEENIPVNARKAGQKKAAKKKKKGQFTKMKKVAKAKRKVCSNGVLFPLSTLLSTISHFGQCPSI